MGPRHAISPLERGENRYEAETSREALSWTRTPIYGLRPGSQLNQHAEMILQCRSWLMKSMRYRWNSIQF
jgi:hypothetical protein